MEPVALFMYFCLSFVAFYAIRYWWVKYQCLRAIDLASMLSTDHIKKCEYAFLVAERIATGEEKEMWKKHTRQILSSHDRYFEEGYYKDYDYNEMWLDPYKWTIKQLFPTLCNMRPLEVLMVDENGNQYNMEGLPIHNEPVWNAGDDGVWNTNKVELELKDGDKSDSAE